MPKPYISMQALIAKSMYEHQHPRSPQWSDCTSLVRKKWLQLAIVAMVAAKAWDEENSK